jgi:flagellar export protein FliJ
VKRYHFALASVMRARRAQEDLARQRLAAANRAVRQAEGAYAALLAESQVPPVLGTAVDVASFQTTRAAEERMARSVESLRRAVIDAEVAAATQRAAWVEAAKVLKSLERLDERRREQWWLEERREEALTTDDIVGARWAARAQSTTGRVA